jgi:hypothetical protein
MLGAARLQPAIYEQVEADPASTWRAILVVVIASVAAAIGLGITEPVEMIGMTIAALVTWMVWVGLTLAIGRWAIPDPHTQTNLGEVVRTTGFSAAPGVLRIFAGIPVVGLPIFLGTTIWMLFSFVVAVRQALDYSSFTRALAVCLLGWIIHGLLFAGFVWIAI